MFDLIHFDATLQAAINANFEINNHPTWTNLETKQFHSL